MNNKSFFLYLLIITDLIFSQQFLFADPFNNLFKPGITPSFRPTVSGFTKGFYIKPNYLFSYSTSPNFDNVGNKFSLRGKNSYYGISYQYFGKNIILLLEPYIINKENKSMPLFPRGGRYQFTNEMSNQYKGAYRSSGFRESLFLLHYNYVGFGISNLNQWLGPGVHNTLTMTNNTMGFNHYFIGTFQEKLINDFIGIDTRYTFSKLNENNGGVYYSSLALSLTFHNQIVWRTGLIRDFLSGGIATDENETISAQDAMALVFGPLFADSKRKLKYTSEWGFEPWDQLLTGFIEIIPNKDTHIYLEVGTGDHRKNLTDLFAHWDHNLAYVIGFKKYLQLPFYKSSTYLIGIEYTTLTGNSNTKKFRGSGPWYDNWWYDYSSFEGRRWAAHSGSDSDDLIFYFGINQNDSSLIIFYSEERKGLYLEAYPEIKKELLLRYTKQINSKFKIITYLEREIHKNYYFIENKYRGDLAFSLQLEYLFSIIN